VFSTRIRDSPFKKRISTLEEGSTVKVRDEMGFFGKSEFGVEFSPIHIW
jgi:hypothetical protein